MLATMQLVISLALLAIPVGFVGYIAYCYLTVTPTTPPMTVGQKLFYATKKSATIFVQLATAAFLALGNGIMNFADFLGAPELKEWVKTALTPEVATGAIAVLLFLTVWARVRNLGASPSVQPVIIEDAPRASFMSAAPEEPVVIPVPTSNEKGS